MKCPVIKVHQLQTIKYGSHVYLRGEEAANTCFPPVIGWQAHSILLRCQHLRDGGRTAWLPGRREVTLGPDRRPHTLKIKVSLES